MNICKFPKGEGSGRYDCSAISCAGKVPRALTGFLASTAHPSQCYGRTGRRNCISVSLFVLKFITSDFSFAFLSVHLLQNDNSGTEVVVTSKNIRS